MVTISAIIIIITTKQLLVTTDYDEFSKGLADGSYYLQLFVIISQTFQMHLLYKLSSFYSNEHCFFQRSNLYYIFVIFHRVSIDICYYDTKTS